MAATFSVISVLSTAEAELLRLAVDLGASAIGGPLSEHERCLVDLAMQQARSDSVELASVRSAIAEGRDPLGDTLSRIRPVAHRRSMGAFYTPPRLVQPMVSWILAQEPRRVVDPGCGSGRFSAAVVREAPELAVVAVDLDPVATLLTRAALAVLGARRATVVQADYTAFELPKIAGRTAFVGNPPYVRHHDLSPEAKARLVALGKELGYSVSSLSGLHAHFYLATAAYAQPGDVGCFVTSSEWIDVGYGALIRNLLVNGLGGCALHIVDPRAAPPFEDAMVTAAIACFRICDGPSTIRLRIVRSVDELRDLDAGHEVGRKLLADARRWTPFLSTPEVHRGGRSRPLGEVTRVHRGVVTGANDFFVLTRERADELGVTRWCRPAITSAEEVLTCGGTLRDGPACRLLLDVPGDIDRRAYPQLDAYLRRGEIACHGKPPIAQRYIASRRRPWWRLGTPPPPPIVVSYMARQAPAFALNPDCLAVINIAHGLYPVKQLNDKQLAALVAYLNSVRQSFRGSGRTYHGGLEKFEPRELEALLIPADGPWSA